jgi:hypothetical protein
MIETLLGGLLGGAFRLAPEVLKLLDRKGERVHELALREKDLESERIQGDVRNKQQDALASQAQSNAQVGFNSGAMQALSDSINAQGQLTHVGWADALSSSVRPVITYWFMALYCAAKTAAFAAGVNAGAGWGDAILHAWTDADQTLWAGVLNFWFLGRVFDRVRS